MLLNAFQLKGKVDASALWGTIPGFLQGVREWVEVWYGLEHVKYVDLFKCLHLWFDREGALSAIVANRLEAVKNS